MKIETILTSQWILPILLILLITLILGGLICFSRIRLNQMFHEGIFVAQSLFDGRPVRLDKNWLGTTFFVVSVFKRLELGRSNNDDQYLLETANELEQKPRLFIITETEYHQLLIEDGIVLGKEYIYTSQVSHPGADVYYFKRQVGMHSE